MKSLFGARRRRQQREVENLSDAVAASIFEQSTDCPTGPYLIGLGQNALRLPGGVEQLVVRVEQKLGQTTLAGSVSFSAEASLESRQGQIDELHRSHGIKNSHVLVFDRQPASED